MTLVCAAAWGHFEACGPCWPWWGLGSHGHWVPHLGPRPCSPWGLVDVCSPGCHQGVVKMSLACGASEAMWMPIGCATHLGPYWREWAALSPEATLVPIVWEALERLVWVHGLGAARGYVHGLCCRQKPYGGPWLVLPPTAKRPFFLAMILMTDCRCTVEKERHGRPLQQPPLTCPPQRNGLDRKSLKNLKKCDGDAEE